MAGGGRVRFMEVRMNGKGRKLFRSAVGILTSVMMMGAYTTTAMASGIGVIDAKDMLDIHAEANTASAVIGQVMEDGHVAILAKVQRLGADPGGRNCRMGTG